jgi:hypothetical protein
MGFKGVAIDGTVCDGWERQRRCLSGVCARANGVGGVGYVGGKRMTTCPLNDALVSRDMLHKPVKPSTATVKYVTCARAFELANQAEQKIDEYCGDQIFSAHCCQSCASDYY